MAIGWKNSNKYRKTHLSQAFSTQRFFNPLGILPNKADKMYFLHTFLAIFLSLFSFCRYEI